MTCLVSYHSRNYTGRGKISTNATGILEAFMFSTYINNNRVLLNKYTIPKFLLLNLPYFFGFFVHGNFEDTIPQRTWAFSRHLYANYHLGIWEIFIRLVNVFRKKWKYVKYMLNKAYKTRRNQYRNKTIEKYFYLREHSKNKSRKSKSLNSVIIALAHKRRNAELWLKSFHITIVGGLGWGEWVSMMNFSNHLPYKHETCSPERTCNKSSTGVLINP